MTTEWNIFLELETSAARHHQKIAMAKRPACRFASAKRSCSNITSSIPALCKQSNMAHPSKLAHQAQAEFPE